MTTRKRKPRSTTAKPAAISHEVAEVVSQHFQERKELLTQRRDLSKLTLFEIGLLPFLYLEAGIKAVFEFINKRYPL
tara:strand:+ start:371 stop:601 length:231 start_codon:yes stop_codon:yes gene_type:complete